MHSFQAHDGNEIRLNLTDRHRNWDGNPKIDNLNRQALIHLAGLESKKIIKPEDYAAADLILGSEILISPTYLFGGKKAFHKEIARYFVANDDFASELYESLSATGALAFLDQNTNSTYQDGVVMRMLSVFALSGLGQGSVGNVPSKYVHGVLSWFRTPDDTRWRPEFDRSPLICQVLKAVTEGLAKIFDDPTFKDRADNKRAWKGRMTGWSEFRRSDDPLQSEMSRRLDAYLSWSKAKPKDMSSATQRLHSWISEHYPSKTLSEVFATKESHRGFPKFLEDRCDLNGSRVYAVCAAAKRLSDHFMRQLESENPATVFYPLISDSELETSKNGAAANPKPSSTRSRPLPEKLFALTKFVLDEGEKGWPGRCSYFYETLPDGRKVYCPVLPTLFRCALDIPLRVVQWRRLDSGEGDVRQYNADEMGWETNVGPWAGYWADRDGEPHENYPTRGYAHEFTDEMNKVTGFFINTNKTSEPYTIPWQHDAVHRRLWKLRLWQEEHNPISAPLTPEQYLDSPDEVPQVTKERLPSILPLFRLYSTTARNFAGRIPTSSEIDHAWQALMAEVQRVWNEDNPDNQISIVEFHPVTGQPRSIYNPHGMRVRGLTDLFRGGVPLELLSKIVAGHATVRMTLYYVDLDAAEIDAQLTAAAVEARSKAAQELVNSFSNMELEEALRKSVALDAAAIAEAHSLPSNVTFTNLDIGFCPFECGRCHDGGPILRSGKIKDGPDKSVYAPVPGGVRNCILCRHFVSGPPWAFQLELYGTTLLEKRRHLGVREEKAAEKLDSLERAYKAGAIGVHRYRTAYGAAESDMTKVKEDQILVENAIHNVATLLHACVKLQSTHDDSGKVPMLAADRGPVVKYIETSAFEHSLLQTAASRVYPILDDPRVEANRDRYLDIAAHASGLAMPRLMPELNDEQRRRAMDHYANLLLRRTSEDERQELVKGHAALQDLSVWEDVQALMDAALGGTAHVGTDPFDAEDVILLEVLK